MAEADAVAVTLQVVEYEAVPVSVTETVGDVDTVTETVGDSDADGEVLSVEVGVAESAQGSCKPALTTLDTNTIIQTRKGTKRCTGT